MDYISPKAAETIYYTLLAPKNLYSHRFPSSSFSAQPLINSLKNRHLKADSLCSSHLPPQHTPESKNHLIAHNGAPSTSLCTSGMQPYVQNLFKWSNRKDCSIQCNGSTNNESQIFLLYPSQLQHTRFPQYRERLSSPMDVPFQALVIFYSAIFKIFKIWPDINFRENFCVFWLN